VPPLMQPVVLSTVVGKLPLVRLATSPASDEAWWYDPTQPAPASLCASVIGKTSRKRITSALLLAFVVAWCLEGTRYAHLTPYADPLILAVLALILVFVPIATVRRALQEILLITPPDLDLRVREVLDEVVARHGFKTYTSYVAKVGRAQFIEIHVEVTPASGPASLAAADAIRREIADAIGGEGPQRWLTIDFTADPRWL